MPDADRSTLEERGRQHLGRLVDTVTDYAIFLLGPDGTVATWNRGAERIKGYTAEEIVGRHFSTFYTPEDIARDHPADELRIARREGRFEEEGWRLRKDGSRFWADVVITCLRDDDGEIVGYAKVTRDLTARRIAEERLRTAAERLTASNASLEQYRRLVASIEDYGIFLLDAGGHVATWNAGARRIKGYTAEEIIGCAFDVFYLEEDRQAGHPLRVLEAAARHGRHLEERWRVRKDGSRFWAGVAVTALRDDDGELVGYAKVTRDLTDQREAAEALRRSNEQLARRNAELDRFTAVAAHDLQEPLSTVAGHMRLLRRAREQLPEESQASLDFVVDATARMQKLISDLLAYARSADTDAPRSPVALAGAVQARGAQLTVSLPAEATVTAARADVDALLRNLLSNAIKFADADDPRVAISGRRTADGWRVEIEDNGIGVLPEDAAPIFAPFRRSAAAVGIPGTGLGLAISKRVAERNGGMIGVDAGWRGAAASGSCSRRPDTQAGVAGLGSCAELGWPGWRPRHLPRDGDSRSSSSTAGS